MKGIGRNYKKLTVSSLSRCDGRNQNTRDGIGLPRNTAGFKRATVFYPKRIAADHSHALAVSGDSVCDPSTEG